MKLTSVEVHAANSSDIIVLSFQDPRGLSQYNVKSILGLDALAIVSQPYPTSGISKFYNLSLEKRDIIIKLGLNPSYGNGDSYSSLRDMLYKMIAASRTGRIQLQFKNNTDIIAALTGVVSKFEAPQFEKLQEVQITIACDEPMLKAYSPINLVVAGLDPAHTVITDALSTAPHGFTFDIAVTQNIPVLTISDPNDSSWNFQIAPVGGFISGDILHFSSDYSKELYLVHSGKNIYLADVVTPGSVWPMLFPGDNTLAFSSPTKLVWHNISYYPTYWGV